MKTNSTKQKNTKLAVAFVVGAVVAILVAYFLGGKIVAQLSKNDSLEFLTTCDGKYPTEVGLFGDSKLEKRLQKLLGERYEFVHTMPKTEFPIVVSDSMFTAKICEQHNCYDTNIIVVADIAQNVVYVGIRVEGTIETYSENGEKHPYIELWEQQE